jgi:LemA protein
MWPAIVLSSRMVALIFEPYHQCDFSRSLKQGGGVLANRYGSTRLLLIVITLNIAAIVGVFFFIHYLRIVRAERAVLEAQVQIVKACHVRTELINPLIKLLKERMPQEQAMLAALVDVQEQSLAALKKMQTSVDRSDIQRVAETQVFLNKTVERVFERVERDDELPKLELFVDLRKQFEEANDSVDAAGQTYNQGVSLFNGKITRFPGMFIAPLFGWAAKGDYEVRDIKIYFQDIDTF